MPDELDPQGFNFDEILAAISATPDPNAPTGDPVLDALTWERNGPDVSHAAGDIPLPGDSTPTLKSEGSKVSVAGEGMTQGGIRKAKGLFGEADQRVAGYSAASAAEANEQAAQLQTGYDDLQAGYELEKQKTAEFQEEENRLASGLIDFHRGAAELEQRLAGEAQAERQQYITAYREQLAAVKVLAAQSGNPMGGLSQGQALGLAGAQFAQGFLAAQGINIDVSGQVDRWVDRSIQEHQMKIQNMRASAEDQLHLYNLSRQNSQDEWEARQRYRGFVIAGLQTAIHLNATRFQSDIAMARAQQQISRLQIEADATERAIADAHHARVAAFMQAEYQRAYQTGVLARESQRIALEQRKQNWEEDPKNPKNKGKDGDPILDFKIADPEYATDANGQPVLVNGQKVLVSRWRVDPKIAAADPVLARQIAKEGDEARQNYSEYLDATNELISSYAEAKKVYDQANVGATVSWDVLDRLDKTGKVHKFLQAKDRWAMAKVYNDSGKAATDVEYKRQSNQVYVDKFLATNGHKGEASIAQLRKDGRGKFERHMESAGFVPISESEQGRYRTVEGASPMSRAQDDATLHGQKPIAGFAATQMAKSLAKDSDDPERKKVSGAWADFKGWDVETLQATARGKLKASEAARDYAKRELDSGQPEYAVAVDNLAAAYARPHFFRVHSTNWGVKVEKDESAKEIREEAYRAIKDLALGNTPDGSRMPGELLEYAGWVKRNIDEDPELSKALEHDDDVDDSPFIKRLNWRSED